METLSEHSTIRSQVNARVARALIIVISLFELVGCQLADEGSGSGAGLYGCTSIQRLRIRGGKISAKNFECCGRCSIGTVKMWITSLSSQLSNATATA